MATGQGPITLNGAVEEIEAHLARFKCEVEAGQRRVDDQLSQKNAEIERMSGELHETKHREGGLQRKLDKLRASESLWKCVARIKMKKLDEMEKKYETTSTQLERKLETNKQLLKVLQETAKFADDLKATAQDYKEKLEGAEKEQFMQNMENGRKIDSLNLQIKDIRKQIEDKERDVDRIKGEKQQCEREKVKLSGQLDVAQLKVTMHEKELETVLTKIAVLEVHNKETEGALRSVTEECLTWRTRAEGTKNAAQQDEPLRNQNMVEDLLEGRLQELREQNEAGPGDNM